MIKRAEHRDIGRITPLFAGWQESCIWSCLQEVMGELYIRYGKEPESVMAILGDFSFFAGEPDEELLCFKPEAYRDDFIIMVPQNASWAERIERCYTDRAKKVTRYAIKKEPGIFNREHLESIVRALPPEYTLKRIDKEIYEWCRTESWCRDWCGNYKSYEMYEKLGMGVVCLKDGAVVAGAASYSTYRDGIEIEIDTKEEFRRRGLASACGARLILDCMERGLYPSWDAQNKWSVALAEKLGYHYERDYTAYEIRGY